jgi:hypothetical protein
MKFTQAALNALVMATFASDFVNAFVPVSLLHSTRLGSSYESHVATSISGGVNHSSSTTSLAMSSRFLGMEDDTEDDDEDSDDEDDEEEEDDEDMDLSTTRSYAGAKSPFTGLALDPWDPNPLIKPRPSRYFKEKVEKKSEIPDDQLVQTMSAEERKENLSVMRQIRKNDLPDLRMRKDHGTCYVLIMRRCSRLVNQILKWFFASRSVFLQPAGSKPTMI